MAGVPAARPDPAEPEAPAPRRGRWIEVPTAGRGLSLAAPERQQAPVAADPAGPAALHDAVPTAPDPRGGASSGLTSWRDGAPAASGPHGAGPSGSASRHDDATPAAGDPLGEGPSHSASPPYGTPAAPEARHGEAFGSAARHDAAPDAADPRGDVGDVLVATADAEAAPADPAPALDIPHPAPESARSHPQGELWPAEASTESPRGSGIPGPDRIPDRIPGGPDADGAAEPATPAPAPDVAELVARAVARGMDATREDDDTQDLPHVRPPRGAAVTEIPVHLPFRAHPSPTPAPTPATTVTPAPAPAPEAARTPRRPGGSTRLPAGRRVPRGDDRLREHRGPVLPGWFALAVGALAMTGCAALLWRAGVVPAALAEAFGVTPRPYRGLRSTHWPPLAFLGIVTLLALGGLGRAKAGHAWVLTLFGRYRGTVRRTGLTWVSPLLLRRRVDVRLRHWRSEPMPAVDSGGLALQVVVQVVWQVKDTARATLAVEDHTEYLAEQVESAMARVLSQLPADAFHEDAPTLRDAEAVGDALTRMLAAETEAVGVEVFSAQPTRIEYAPEVAEAMRRRRVAAIDAKHRDSVLTSVVDAVDDTVHRLTSRGIVELDDYERKALVKDLTVAFYTGRAEQ
ncbi:SPFH domain-containing protein [Streptomyces sp. NPDC057939]|uniref:SPFH domain-containing protein n=1 Tax=Streptomyces sp. NPDC057939 TaxID=3346284 RepID=UPI0036EA956F